MSAVAEKGGDRAANESRRAALMDMYRAFNARDAEAATSRMTPDVDWPNGTTDGRVCGPSAVRRYWENQWREMDPRVEPLKVDFDDAGDAHVRVHQLVRSRDGAILEDRKIEHIFGFEGPFISRMTVVDRDPEPDDDEEDEE